MRYLPLSKTKLLDHKIQLEMKMLKIFYGIGGVYSFYFYFFFLFKATFF